MLAVKGPFPLIQDTEGQNCVEQESVFFNSMFDSERIDININQYYTYQYTNGTVTNYYPL